MTKITESRTRDILHWLDDRLAEPDLPYQAMALLRDAAALIRQLQSAEQAAWHAGLDAGREQGRGKDHAHQPPIALVGEDVKAYPLWRAIHSAAEKEGRTCNVGLAQVATALDFLAAQPGGSDNGRD